MTGTEEQFKLVGKISKGEIRKPEVEKELDRISKEYGDDCFNSYAVHKKPQPWDEGYLDELKILSTSGAASKDFYLHMAEVSDYLNDNKKKESHKKVGFLAGIAVVVLIIIVVLNVVN